MPKCLVKHCKNHRGEGGGLMILHPDPDGKKWSPVWACHPCWLSITRGVEPGSIDAGNIVAKITGQSPQLPRSRMNLYRVISEELSVTVPILDDGTGPQEYGCIAHLVAAEYGIDAAVAAWKTDQGRNTFKSFTGDLIDMPKFTCELVAEGLDIPAGIYSGDPRYEHLWSEAFL
jgi:hypothetical protein